MKELAERHHDEIVAKCHPAIFDVAQLYKELIKSLKALGPNAPRERIVELEDRMVKGLGEIHQKYSGPVPPEPNRFAAQTIFSEAALSGKTPDELGILEFLHWERHKIPLKKDLERYQARDGDAAHRILQTGRDYEALRCDHKRPKPFKGNLEHSNMFDVLWGFGIESLTPETLAAFFDYYCSCGIEPHDPDALRKLRTRFQKTLREAADDSRTLRNAKSESH